MKAKAQVWSLDIVIAIVIFSAGLIIFYTYGSNLTKTDEDQLSYMLQDAKTISSFLVSSGYPDNWTSQDVVTIGLTNSNFLINDSKVQKFSQLATTNYSITKKILSTRSDYFIYFENNNGTTISLNGIKGMGKSGVNQTNIYESENPEQVISIYRFAIYNKQIIRIGVLVW